MECSAVLGVMLSIPSSPFTIDNSSGKTFVRILISCVDVFECDSIP